MAWRPKEALVLVVDVGKSMQETFAAADDGSKVTRAQTALGVARRLVQHRLFFAPKEEVGLVFCGTEETNNDLQADDEYAHVYVCRNRKIDVTDVDALKNVSQAPKGGAKSDAVAALIVALDLMIKRTKDLKYARSIKLITDESSAHPGDADLMECVKQLQATGTQLSVTLVGSSSSGAWGALKGEMNVQLVSLQQLLQEARLRVKPVEQRAKVRLSLVVSPEMEIPIGVYSKTTRVSFPTLKKQSKMAAAMPTEERKSDKVILDRTYYATDDKEGEEVKKEDRVKGFKYGQNIVPMSEYDEAALSYSCDRTLTTLGFADAASVTPESSLHSVDVVAADKGDTWAYYAFESLVQAMESEKRVLIARYCFRKDSQPRMVALIPKKEPGSAAHLVLQYLPFMEDIREWTCASLPEPNAEQKAFANVLVDALTLSSEKEVMRPEDVSNPSLARFYDFLADRAVNPGAKLLPATSDQSKVLEAPEEAQQALAKALPENERDKVKKLFGLEKVEKTVGRERKRFWREAIAEKTKNSAALIGEVDTKKIKVDAYTGAKKSEEKDEDKAPLREVKGEDSQGADDSMAVAVGVPPRVHIGSVHPERDFERWLNERRTGGVDVVAPAIEQMCDVILRFAEEGEEFHGKALACLATLRRGCVREAEYAGYNEFLRKLRLRLTRRLGMLWERVCQDMGLGLIIDTEVTSTVTAGEAKAFLEGKDVSPAAASATATATAPGAPPTALSERELEAMIE